KPWSSNCWPPEPFPRTRERSNGGAHVGTSTQDQRTVGVRSARCVPEAALECDPRYARGGPPRREFAVRDPQGRGGCREDCPGRRRRRSRASRRLRREPPPAREEVRYPRGHTLGQERDRAPVRTCCACS